MTAPGWRRLAPGHWLLIGIVVLLVAGLAFVVVRGDGDQGKPQTEASRTTSASSSSTAPACLPRVTDIGYSIRYGGYNFGLVVHNPCKQVVGASSIRVTPLGTNGKPLSDSQAVADLEVPVLLPGQDLSLGDELFVGSATVSKLQATVDHAANFATTDFASWPRDVRVTDIKHFGPDAAGRTAISGTVAVPETVSLCHPEYYLMLRNKAHQIIYGAHATLNSPSFTEKLPGGVDWSTAQISVALGTPYLTVTTAKLLTCRA